MPASGFPTTIRDAVSARGRVLSIDEEVVVVRYARGPRKTKVERPRPLVNERFRLLLVNCLLTESGCPSMGQRGSTLLRGPCDGEIPSFPRPTRTPERIMRLSNGDQRRAKRWRAKRLDCFWFGFFVLRNTSTCTRSSRTGVELTLALCNLSPLDVLDLGRETHRVGEDYKAVLDLD